MDVAGRAPREPTGEPRLGLRRTLGLVRDRRRAALGLVLLAAATGASAAGPWLLGRAVDEVQSSDEPGLVGYALAIFAVGLVYAALWSVALTMANRVGLRAQADLRIRLFDRFVTAPLALLRRRPVGELVSRASAGLIPLAFFVGEGASLLVLQVMICLWAAGAMLLIDAELALLALVPTVALAVAVALLWGRARRAQEEAQRALADLTTMIGRRVAADRIVKAYRLEGRERDRLAAATRRRMECAVLAARPQALLDAAATSLPYVGFVLVLLVGGRSVIDGQLTLGGLTSFSTYLLLLAGSLSSIGTFLSLGQDAAASAGRAFEVIDEDDGLAAERTHGHGEGRLPPGPAPLRLERVSVDGRPRPALDAVSLDVPAGARVALLGATGAGKSTLLEVVAGLAEPSGGELEIDGLPAREIDSAVLSRALGFVSQDAQLFSMSIAENIAYGTPGVGRQAIVAAARRAGAHDFIAALPSGYDTPAGEAGRLLSGGQRQRIAIARAIVESRRALLLDNPTSALDPEGRRLVLGELLSGPGPTRLIASVDRAAVADSDLVVILDHGAVSSVGSAEELLVTSEEFRDLASSLGVERA